MVIPPTTVFLCINLNWLAGFLTNRFFGLPRHQKQRPRYPQVWLYGFSSKVFLAVRMALKNAPTTRYDDRRRPDLGSKEVLISDWELLSYSSCTLHNNGLDWHKLIPFQFTFKSLVSSKTTFMARLASIYMGRVLELLLLRYSYYSWQS